MTLSISPHTHGLERINGLMIPGINSAQQTNKCKDFYCEDSCGFSNVNL